MNEINRFQHSLPNCGFHNFSLVRKLSPMESLVLSCGLKFIPTPASTLNSEIFHDIDVFVRRVRLRKWALCNDLNSSNSNHLIPRKGKNSSSFEPPPASFAIEKYLNEARLKIYGTLLTHSIRASKKNSVNNSPNGFMKVVKTLHDDDTINIVPSDKNLGLCIVDRTWYLDAARTHLHDKKTYEKVPLMPLISTIYLELRNILACYHILYTNSEHSHLTPLASFMLSLENAPLQRLCKFYILVKIHKTPMSSRPISSNTKYLSWHASKFLDHRLKPFLRLCSSYTPNSQVLVKILEKRRFPKTCYLLEADVDNLYPSIPVVDGLIRLSSFLRMHGTPSKEVSFLTDLCKWVLENNYCTFNGEIYRQVNGTAMGTPFAVVYACIFLTSLENEVYSNLTSYFDKPIFYKRYIDDVFAVFSSDAAATKFITIFNSILPSIHLSSKTSTKEANFLDLTIYKGKRFDDFQIFDVKLFQKPINNYVYLPPFSFHSGKIFRGIILGELRRYRINCSDDAEFSISKDLLFKRLCMRGYSPANIAPLFSMDFDRAALLEAITLTNGLKFSSLGNVVFTSSRTPRTLSLDLRRCLEYPDYLQSDMHFSNIFSGTSPLVSFRRTKNLSESIINRP